jgi:hypothetical protein
MVLAGNAGRIANYILEYPISKLSLPIPFLSFGQVTNWQNRQCENSFYYPA